MDPIILCQMPSLLGCKIEPSVWWNVEEDPLSGQPLKPLCIDATIPCNQESKAIFRICVISVNVNEYSTFYQVTHVLMHDVLSPYVWWCHTGSLTLVPVTRGLNFLQCQSQNSTSKLEPRLGPGIVSTPAYFGCCFFFFFLAAVFMQPLFQNSSCQLVKSFCLVGWFFSVW